MNNDQRIAEITARCEAATPGPWWPGEDETIETPTTYIAYRLNTLQDATFIAHAREDIPFLLDQIAALTAERDRLTEAQRRHVDCTSAERQHDGTCLGYGRSEHDDEPCEQCKRCPVNSSYEPELETKTIQQWAALDGIKVYDPDGFDRTDPFLWEKRITKAEYMAGIMRCTVAPLPAAPKLDAVDKLQASRCAKADCEGCRFEQAEDCALSGLSREEANTAIDAPEKGESHVQ